MCFVLETQSMTGGTDPFFCGSFYFMMISAHLTEYVLFMKH